MAITLIQQGKEEVLITSEINERYPVFLNGIVAHYPLDGRGGTIDVINGETVYDNIDNGANILAALDTEWRNPSNWNVTCTYDEVEDAIVFPSPNVTALFNVFIPIRTNKKLMMSVTSKSAGNGIFYSGTISYDANKNQLPGTSSSYDYFVTVGTSVTPNYTTYLNSSIGGAPKTGESTNTGDYTVWHTGTKYAKIMLLPDYNGTSGPHYIKNLKFYYTDVDTSSVIIENKGIAIQESTINLLVTKPNNVFGPWGGFTGKSMLLILPDNKQGARLLSYNGGGCQWLLYGDITVIPNTTYTVSAKVRSNNLGGIHQNLFYFYQYNSGGGYITEQGYFNSANTKYIGDGWYWAWGTFTTSSTTTRLSFQGYEYSGNLSIEIYDWQFEQRAFPTAFVGYGVSKSKGGLYISIPQVIQNSPTPFPLTITCECEYMLNGGQNGEGNEPTVCYPITWWGYNGVLNQINRSFFNGKTKGRLTMILRQTDWACYWDSTLMSSGGYFNGIRPAIDQVITFGARGFETDYPRMNAWYSNVSFYNRELSLTDLATLSPTKLQISSAHYISPSFNEKPKVQTFFHFPLGLNTNDITNTINAQTNANVVFENGVCWVGSTTTNLLYNSNNSFANINSIYGAGARSTKTTINNDSAYFKVFTAAEVLRVYCNLSDLVWGNYYTTSLYAEKSANIGIDWNDIGGSFLETNNIVKITSNQSNGGTYNSTYRFFDINLNVNGTYRLSNAQVESRQFRTPYVWGTRGETHLTYNFNRDIGLDWSGNWTICYWKKPMGTYDNTMTAYNIESVGCNGNTVGGGYIWWGKTAGADSIQLASPGTFAPADYFSKWQFVSMVKAGTTLTIITWNVGATNHVRTIDLSGIPANYYVTQYGYDFKLSGWDNGSPCNSYFRDLVVAKYALSSLELQNVKNLNVNNNETYLTKIIEI